MSMRGHHGEAAPEIKPYRVALAPVTEGAKAPNLLKHTLIIGAAQR